ncbi:NADP-dependent 3-hydroxy acid dehydrogenase YdfG [Streptomyces sp. 3213]|uniref:SDR family NAD(P)-dependent oxidoreductase n=1 Tax=Streptomyces sp. 3213.3 TaxID=1855348 RepID=UPI000895373C|nr:SDR family NAD(P)-dependent oxidoreductase [Streptomyces sp. 3213.3]SEE73353.1 NADP-dependent 3-hydroxy acid dehydrogenase YdfG [Streptomyces sp. 3213] [Streptomyces sp. 3213.3]
MAELPLSTPRTVLVTGATGGVGSAVARALHTAGWTVYAAHRRPEDAEALRDAGFTPVRLELTDEDSVFAAAEQIGSRLDGLVNSAAIMGQGPVELTPTEAWRRQFEINVIGQATVIRAFLPALRASGGRIVNIGAVSARVPPPFFGPIAASKAALAALTHSLRAELRHQGVKVTLVEPGAMDTSIFATADKASADLGRAGSAKTQEHYARALDAVRATAARQPLGPVAPAVDAVVRALTARRPATLTTTGRDGRALALLRFLPDGLRDRLVLKAFGVTAEAFEDAPLTESPAAGPR